MGGCWGHTVRRYSPAKEGNIPFSLYLRSKKTACLLLCLLSNEVWPVAKTFFRCWLCSPSFLLPDSFGGPSGPVWERPIWEHSIHSPVRESDTCRIRKFPGGLCQKSTCSLWEQHLIQHRIHAYCSLSINATAYLFTLAHCHESSESARCSNFQPFNMQAPHIQLLSTYPVPSTLGNKKMKVDGPAPKPVSLQETTMIKWSTELLRMLCSVERRDWVACSKILAAMERWYTLEK